MWWGGDCRGEWSLQRAGRDFVVCVEHACTGPDEGVCRVWGNFQAVWGICSGWRYLQAVGGGFRGVGAFSDGGGVFSAWGSFQLVGGSSQVLSGRRVRGEY